MANIQGPVGNTYDKFNTKNPIARYLMDGFLGTFTELFALTSGTKILEIGCGEGEMLRTVKQQRDIDLHGFDVDIPLLVSAKQELPDVHISLGDGHQIAYPDKSFDIVFACEVLEHVARPAQVLAEAQRVAREYAIFSVPREPIWRALNMLRGKYLSEMGNTPGHIQHWSTQSFVAEVQQHFDVIEVRQPLPWTMLLCKTR